MAAIQGVILDIDGTLVDSNEEHATAWQRALAAEGIEKPYSDIRALIGMGPDQLLPRLAGVSRDSPRGKRLVARKSEIFHGEYLSGIRPFPKARALLFRLRDEGLRLAVASSSESGELRRLLRIVDPEEEVPWLLPKATPRASKPDPEILELALKRLELRPSEVLMLGDSPHDVRAAMRAGVDIIALRCGGWDGEELRGALEIYRDPEHLLEHFESSPFKRGREFRAA
ncbi:MAG: HAD family hydrolase [Oligoflexia bacterium]|nr:HAD family hydrolase [Oligoflexia bacterium]